MKVCKQCLMEKPESDYYISKGYLAPRCKRCTNENLSTLRSTNGTDQWWHRRRQRIRARAIRKGRKFDLTAGQVKEILSQKYCIYCGIEPTVKSIDRKDNEKDYIVSNCVMACWDCNTLKGTLTIKQIEMFYKIACINK